MPVFIFVPYLFLEAFAFYAVSKWLGVGWALFALFVCFIGGLALAAQQMRSIAVHAAEGRTTAGRAAGDTGLVAAGAVGVALPGFITTLFGLLLLIPPTRGIVRRLMARNIRRYVEDLGVRSYEMTSQYSKRASYGSFVIDEEPLQDPKPDTREIQRWAKDVSPDDF